ncbi:MAG TPA: response regulator [Actinomycetota bacterium]|nr:response regulator [Actinomycetota bacterium]
MARASRDNLRLLLPTGGTLPAKAWESRHRAILAILWAHVPGLVLFGLASGVGALHAIAEPAMIAAAAGLASLPFPSRRLRAALATFGLVTSSALLVHFSGGVIEFHFHFFVVVAIVTLYQDWTPFLLAIAYVLLHHGILGGLYPHDVFNHPAALTHPWRWAALHALFIAGESVALLAAWRYAEQGQQETLRSIHRLNQAQDVARIATWTWDPRTDSVEVRDDIDHLAWRKSGMEPPATLEEWLGRIHPDDRPGMREALEQAAKTHSAVSFDTHRDLPDGSQRFFTHVAESTMDSTNRKLCVVGASRDVTEEKRLYAQLLQGQKMDAIGRLAGGIAHDFNNLLAVVINYARFLVDELDEGDARRADALEILKAGERGATLTRQLLTFSRKEIIQPQVVDLNEVVLSLEKMLRRTLSESIKLVTKTAPDLPSTKIDLGQIEQVLLNLAVNSRDAMPRGGMLSIESYGRFVDEEMALQHPGLKPGEYVCLAVSDTGAGMSDEIKARVFEPFFTTKPKEKGTGLGLSSVYGIMKQNNGYVSVYSEPGVGTTFRLYFPPAGERALPLTTEAKPEQTRGHGEKVLVVEDEPAVLELVGRILGRNGYAVISATTGQAGLELIQQEQGVDLLLTDVILPQISGKELSRRSGLPTIFMSGYTDEIVAEQGILGQGERLIQKPFDPASLLRIVRSALDDASEAPGRAPADQIKRALHVLVIEDDPQIKDLLRQTLGSDESVARISEAGTTIEALALCRSEGPDVIVADSVVQGPEETPPGQAIRAEFPSVPIISFSGRDQIRAWADVHILKDVHGVASVIETVRDIARGASVR